MASRTSTAFAGEALDERVRMVNLQICRTFAALAPRSVLLSIARMPEIRDARDKRGPGLDHERGLPRGISPGGAVMRYSPIPRIGVPLFVLLLLCCGSAPLAWAQTAVGPGVSGRPSEGERSVGAWLDNGVSQIFFMEGIVLLVSALGCGVVVAATGAFDRRRERIDEQATRLHGRIATALQRDRLLRDLAVTPIVHLPRWRWSGATIELRGRVPTVWLRYAILRIAEQEAARSERAYHLQDRMTIVPSM